jgi:K+-transporting ATPase ATPase C chain
MRRDIATSVLAVVVLTILCGLAYPLAVTGVSQLVAPGTADGSLVTRDGKTVGSRLIGQDFTVSGYFQSRPSQTDYSADATAFSNAGPASRKLAASLRDNARAYLRREGPDNPGLRIADIPADALTTSASGIDPAISVANARLQARRVARQRRLPTEQVLALVDLHTSGRFLGFAGNPAVNVLELNLALDAQAGRR